MTRRRMRPGCYIGLARKAWTYRFWRFGDSIEDRLDGYLPLDHDSRPTFRDYIYAGTRLIAVVKQEAADKISHG